MPNDFTQPAQDVASDISNTVRDAARRATDVASDLADSASDMFQGDQLKQIGDQARKFVKGNPVAAIVGAVAVGIIVGRLLTRN